MLVPPPRLTAGPETTTTATVLDSAQDVRMPEGIWSGVDVLQLPAPMPHPTDLSTQVINPLAGDMHTPGTFTSGVRLAPVPTHLVTGPGRAKKPKNSLGRNKSSYLSRTMIYDRFHHLFSEKARQGQGANQAGSGGPVASPACWVSVGRGVTLLETDLDSPHRADPLARVLFTKAWPLVHAINAHTRSASNMDLIMGMSTGDIIWIEMVSARYNRINKVGNLTHSPITCISWLPGTESLVAVGHADGTFVIYDVERDDGPAISPIPAGHNHNQSFHVFVSSKRQSRSNPVAAYKLGNQPITDIAFNSAHSAAFTSRDGYLRLMDLDAEQITDIIPSFFGGLFCAAYSPDGHFIATAGEDDMISIYSVANLKLMARLSGHKAWVRRVAWDVFASDCESSYYRLGSVGEDGWLLLWEFNPSSLPRAKVHDSNGNKTPTYIGRSRVHPFEPRDSVPSLFPSGIAKPDLPKIDQLPLTDLYFTQAAVSVVASDGHLWTWKRPKTLNGNAVH